MATNNKYKWRTLIGLVLVFIAFGFNLNWVWAILFLIWVIPDLFSGVTHFMEPISKTENPLLYWLIMGTWLLMSGFMLVDTFAPQVLPQGWSSASYSNTAYDSQYATLEADTYSNYGSNATMSSSEKSVLKYKTHSADVFNIVGISATTAYTNDEVAATYKELWDAFLKEDISTVIPDIIDDKIYIIQSDLDENMEGKFTLTIGYKTASLDNIYKGLNGVKVAASKYAVFETNKDASTLWEQIMLSDLDVSNTNNVEVYHYNEQTQSIEKTDIWVAVPTSKSELAALKSKRSTSKKSQTSTSTTKSKPVVSVQKSIEKYIPASTDLSTSSYSESNTIYDYSEEEVAAYEAKYPTQKQAAFHVIGLQTKVNYNDEAAMSKAIERLWNDFLKRDYSKSKYIKDITDREHAYVTYTDYTENEVTITLGYKTKGSTNFKSGINLNAVNINANDYYNFQLSGNSNDFEGEEWDTLLEVLQYRAANSADFEVYSFDKKYNITDIQMWVAAK